MTKFATPCFDSAHKFKAVAINGNSIAQEIKDKMNDGFHSENLGDTRALDMTTTICHIHTLREELVKFSKLADVLVSATGVPGLVTKDMIKPGACVIDVGITCIITEEGKSKITGNVDYDEVKMIAGFITPVPGGVGLMTVAMLMQNTVWTAERNANK